MECAVQQRRAGRGAPVHLAERAAALGMLRRFRRQQPVVQLGQLRRQVLGEPGVRHNVLRGATLCRVGPEHVLQQVLRLH